MPSNSNDKGNFDNEEEEFCCDSPKISKELGFYVCLNCGLVYDRSLDDSPRRAFTQEEIQKRKSSESVYSHIGPRTIISGSRDARGIFLSPKYKSKFNRLAKIHRSLTTSYERNLWIALPDLQRLQKKLGVTDTVAEDALRIYMQTVKKKLTMGRRIDTLLAASFYCALRVHGIPKTVEEITEVAQVPKKEVIKSYRLILMEILPRLNLEVQHIGPIRYVDKFNDELKLSMQCRNIAVKIIENSQESGYNSAGKEPKGIAAAAVYIGSKICSENRTQKEIIRVARVTEVTLQMRVKDLMKWYRKGLILNTSENHEEEIKFYDVALEIDPKDKEAWSNKGLVLLLLGKYEEAIDSLDKALNIDPEDITAWYNKVISLTELEKYEEAIDSLDKALEIDPEDETAWWAWCSKGKILIHLEQYKEAIDSLDKALEIAPEYKDALDSKELALDKLKKY